MDTLVIENTLKLIASIVLWMAIGQTLLLFAIYFKLSILTKQKGGDNSNDEGNTINNRIKE